MALGEDALFNLRRRKRKKQQKKNHALKPTSYTVAAESSLRPAKQGISGGIAAVLVFSICFGVYFTTASKSIAGGDAGELGVSACSLAVAHPPGFPLFTMLYHVWGSRASSFNVLSALLSSIAAVVLFNAIDSLAESPLTSASATFGYAFSSIVWDYASQMEVFPLSNLFIAILLRLSIWLYHDFTRNKATVCAFVSGLAMSNQHTSIFFIVPIAVGALVHWPKRFLSLPVLLSISSAFLTGLLPYLFLPYASASKKMYSWGDQTSWKGFMTHLLRREYGTFQLGADSIAFSSPLITKLSLYARHILAQTIYISVPIAFLGLLGFMNVKSRWRRALGRSIAFSLIFYIIVFHYLANLNHKPLLLGVLARFWQFPDMLVFFFIGIGWRFVRERLANWHRAIAVLSMVLWCVQLGLHWEAHWDASSGSKGVVDIYARAVLDSFPPNAKVLAFGDIHINALSYLQQCEHHRKDVLILPVSHMTYRWFDASLYKPAVFPGKVYDQNQPGGYTTRSLLDANIGSGPLFSCGQLPTWPNGDQSHNRRYQMNVAIPQILVSALILLEAQRWTYGLCGEILPASQPPPNVTAFLLHSYKQLPHQLPPFDPLRFHAQTWEFQVYVMTAAHTVELFQKFCGQLQTRIDDAALVDAMLPLADRILSDARLPIASITKLVVYRDVGLVFGLHSRRHRPSELRMYEAFVLYLARLRSSEGDVRTVDEMDRSVAEIVLHKFNIYTNKRIKFGQT